MDDSIRRNINENYIENTDEYERALSALLNPKGKRLLEIADSEHVQVSEQVLRKVAQYLTEEHILLIDSDGEKNNPRLYRNKALDYLKRGWRMYCIHGPDKLQERREELIASYNAYRDKTPYDNPNELLRAIKESDERLDNISIEEPQTGEIFWDIYQPWENILFRIKSIELAMDMSDYIEPRIESMEIDVTGQFGDFSNMNAVKSKLGLEEQPSDNSTLNDDGTLSK